MGSKFANEVLSHLAQYIFLIVLFLPVFCGFLFMRLSLILARIRLYCGKKHSAHMSHFHGGKMYEVSTLSTEEQLDFKRHRSHTYVKQLTIGSLWEMSKFIGNKQQIPLIEDHVIHYFMLNSLFCHGLKRGEKHSKVLWTLPFDTLDNYHLFDGFYWDIKEIRLLEHFKVALVDRAGKIHTSKSPTWALAKAHAQAQMTFFAPGLAHNHVHFVFPSLMSFHVRTVLPETSVLRQLVEPHTRFTQYINYQALSVCQSTSNTGSFADRWLRPWLSIPITKDDFVNGVQGECERFYYENFKLKQDLREELPYHKFLKAYYEVVYKFVKRLEPLLVEDYATLASSVEGCLPSISRHSLVDVITTLVWNCGVVHFSDHQSYLEKFGWKYGCMSMRIPLVTPQGVTSKVDEKALVVDETEEYCHLFTPEDVYRTRCFYNCFVQYNDCSELDMTLPATEYNFNCSEARVAANRFKKDLEVLDKDLRQKEEDIVPLKTIVRSVCF